MSNYQILCGDSRAELAKLPPGSVHCCVTSPPYFGLRAYKAGDAEVGRERTVAEYVAALVAVFGEVRRVLRDDGLLFVNLGSSYAAGKGASGQGISPDEQAARRASGQSLNASHHQIGGKGKTRQLDDRAALRESGYKPGDLIDIPHLVGEALRADGWYLRSVITWVKGLSLCPTYSGSCMPESAAANGTYWVRHRVKVAKSVQRNDVGKGRGTPLTAPHRGNKDDFTGHGGQLEPAKWIDCPGCAKCSPHGGYVLKRGNGRPTNSTEIVLMLAKTESYYYDAEGVKENCVPYEVARRSREKAQGLDSRYELTRDSEGFAGQTPPSESSGCRSAAKKAEYTESGRCLCSAWAINPGGNSDVAGSHFAMFPAKLPETCIKMATSERGVCPKCGAPWARVLGKAERKVTDAMRVAGCDSAGQYHGEDAGDYRAGEAQSPSDSKRSILESMATANRTLDWWPTCECGETHWHDGGKSADVVPYEPVPATVLDPFSGMATTGKAALSLGRSYVGCELNPDYAERSRQRLAKVMVLL